MPSTDRTGAPAPQPTPEQIAAALVDMSYMLRALAEDVRQLAEQPKADDKAGG